jgi:hypothetical protein
VSRLASPNQAERPRWLARQETWARAEVDGLCAADIPMGFIETVTALVA